MHTRECPPSTRRGRLKRLLDRRDAVHAGVERVLWTEYEPSEAADAALDEIAERCEAATLEPDFLDQPIVVHAARICAAMGLPVPKDAPALENQPAAPPAEDSPWRSSG